MTNTPSSSFDEGLAKLKAIENLWLRGRAHEALDEAEKLSRAETTQGGDTSVIGGRAQLFIAERLLNKSDIFGALGALSQARDMLESKTQPTSSLTGRIKAVVGATYQAQGMSQEASFFFREATTRPLSPNEEDTWYLSGTILAYASDDFITDDLMKIFAESSQAVSKHHPLFMPEAYLSVARKSLKRQNYSFGKEILLSLLKILPQESAYYQPANALMQAYDSRSKNPQAVLSDALTELHEGNREAGEMLALEILPRLTESVDVIESLHLVGMALITHGKEESAEALMSKAYEFIKTTSAVPAELQGEIIHNLGILAAQNGDEAKAIKLLNEAIQARTKFFGAGHNSVAESKHALSIIQKAPVEEPQKSAAPQFSTTINENVELILSKAYESLERSDLETAKHLVQAALVLIRAG